MDCLLVTVIEIAPNVKKMAEILRLSWATKMLLWSAGCGIGRPRDFSSTVDKLFSLVPVSYSINFFETLILSLQKKVEKSMVYD